MIMNLKIFAEKFIKKAGLSDAGTDYDEKIGKSVIALITVLRSQGHSGYSVAFTRRIFNDLLDAYESGKGEIWEEYWNSEEGKKFKVSIV